MISLYKIENTRGSATYDYIAVELRGLSTDTKPTEYSNKKIDNGSTFIEIDTGKIYMFDLDGSEWKEM